MMTTSPTHRISRLFVALVAAIGFVGAAHAADTPDAVIKSTVNGIRADIDQNHAKYQSDKSAFYKMVDTKIVPHFDTTYIAKVILGSHLRQASPEQISQFENAFKDMLVHSYADKLLQYYDSVDIQVKPARIDDGGKRASVDTTIVRKDGNPPIPVTFSMRMSDGQWKVWDIKAENISLVLNFRTQIDAEIKKSSIEDVIKRLNSGQIQAADVTPAGAGKN
ncbi:MlaC/ttg2D family ABC transporter substrate-binding protein [Solimonas marina]|uniref:ABC transporter substrate-binding protein n=1 Tax=Solimonas marina TaxID=2714601 RepID=A0A969WCV8_9GAMM|nr:ABC transporter substrate-binding protein [Solimonas marina]NKF23884.1 ABC transporter substrate-binding protein [Solimonas marina]